jgi:acetyl-CoA carboxylase biotin carboxyl carrier protein
MNLKEVKDLVAEILRSDISEFELEHTGTRIKLRRGIPASDGVVDAVPGVIVSGEPVAIPAAAPAAAKAAAAEPAAEPSDEGIHFITSPIVGTFYRAPSPGAEPYVKIGDTVEEGAILCVVEAMKLMNEIPSDMAGEIVRIFVENSYPVEFGQKLFGIRARK